MRRSRTLLALLVISALIVGLHAAAGLGLRGPTGLGIDELRTWFDDPVTALATICRWLALILAYYLFAVVAAVGLLDPQHVPASLVRFVPPGLTTAIGVALGISATAVPAVIHMNSVNPAPERSNVLVMKPTEERLVLLEHEPAIRPLPMPSAMRSQEPILRAAPPPDLVIVETGDSFWSLAEEMLRDHADQTDTLTDETIAAYWRVLIEANQDRLIEPGNPDLLMPGQELLLPPIARGPE